MVWSYFPDDREVIDGCGSEDTVETVVTMTPSDSFHAHYSLCELLIHFPVNVNKLVIPRLWKLGDFRRTLIYIMNLFMFV